MTENMKSRLATGSMCSGEVKWVLSLVQRANTTPKWELKVSLETDSLSIETYLETLLQSPKKLEEIPKKQTK